MFTTFYFALKKSFTEFGNELAVVVVAHGAHGMKPMCLLVPTVIFKRFFEMELVVDEDVICLLISLTLLAAVSLPTV
jgi:hypothetical protein